MMSEALARAGWRGTPSPAAAPAAAPAPAPAEPCSPQIGHDLGVMVALLGEARTLALLEAQASAPYGKDRRVSAISGALQSARDKLPLAKSKAISQVCPPSLRAADLEAWLEERICALRDGSYAAWAAQSRAEESAAKAISAPVLGADEDEEAFSARVHDWAEQIPVGVLRRLCPGYGDQPDVGRYAHEQCRARRLKAEEAAKAARNANRAAEKIAMAADLEALRAEIDAGASLARLRALVDALPYEAREDGTRLVAPSAQVWASGVRFRERDPGTAPPQGWAGLPTETVARWANANRSAATPGAAAELVARLGAGAVVAVPSQWEGHDPTQIWLGPSGPVRIAGDKASTNIPARVSDTPGPSGWAEPDKNGSVTWCGPPVYAALARILDRARAPGGLDVARVMDAYGRHPEKNFPRFLVGEGRAAAIVGVDDPLGPVLDDLALVRRVAPARIPAAAYWLHAEARRTQAGGLRICPARGAVRAALVTVTGHEQRLSRKTIGATDYPRDDSPALAVTGSGGSNAHRYSVVVGVISEGRPLLMGSGVGYRLGADPGTVERVPGLA